MLVQHEGGSRHAVSRRCAAEGREEVLAFCSRSVSVFLATRRRTSSCILVASRNSAASIRSASDCQLMRRPNLLRGPPVRRAPGGSRALTPGPGGPSRSPDPRLIHRPPCGRSAPPQIGHDLAMERHISPRVTGGRSAPRVSAMSEHNDRLVWIDCEMTGLDLERDALVEVAGMVTDAELNVLGEGVESSSGRPRRRSSRWSTSCATCTRRPGLLDELEAGITLEDAEAQVLAYVRAHVPVARKAPLAGQHGVRRPRLPRPGHAGARRTPALPAASTSPSIKELARRWYPRVYFNAPGKARRPPRAGRHPRERSRSCKYYRQAVFVPQPGPDTETARALAQQFTRRGTEQRRARRDLAACMILLSPRSARCGMVGVAQLVEHLVVVQVAAGSSPVTHPT